MRISRISTVALLAAAAGLLAACQPSVDDLVKDQARLAQILEKCTAMGDKAAQDRLCQTANEADAQVKALAAGGEAAPAAEEAPAVAETPAEDMGEQAPAAGGEAAPAVEEGAPAAEENAVEEAPAMGEEAPAAAEGEAAPAEETH